ncbi:hypothetical protein Csa_020682 [Cucumis sativus]|uniref:Uncharacterized protein n=1 Tax=Cucumis sativus TaxID=3659 RepID=A0A0A0KEA8_CUCSA|nr:hypothetical protein Csa_020682 [Cucumis sativus]
MNSLHSYGIRLEANEIKKFARRISLCWCMESLPAFYMNPLSSLPQLRGLHLRYNTITVEGQYQVFILLSASLAT